MSSRSELGRDDGWVPGKLLFTLEDAGRLLSLSKREVENLVRAGELESGIAPGTIRARRISRRQLDRYVEKLETHPRRTP
ncbi:MAG: helix-turn-helix domain-containing protein [Fimbriimonadaceae bacterium]